MESKQNIFFRLFKLWVWVWIIWLIYFWNSYSTLKTEVLVKETDFIEIPSWASYSVLPSILNENHIKVDELPFKVYTKINSLPDLKAGTFYLKEGMTLEGVIDSLKYPIVDEVDITILEGRNIYDIDKLLADKELIEKWELISKNDDFESLRLAYPFLKDALTLEGYIYPDTYTVLWKGFEIDDFLKKALSNFDKKVFKELEFDGNLYDILKLASIVENEEKNSLNKKTVAGILQNRIDSNDFIGADITVCYPYKLTFDECTGTFIATHIRDKNEYNTRSMVWLPKTPIGNPSFETIEATLNYKDTNYYYYLHDKRGIIRYARTYEGHLANIERYLR